ncbi:MAG: hypothetical protein JNM10_07245 [Planctomycetia bacterium]|nr:hypothetical protein [Planctomycetia bacterium]
MNTRRALVGVLGALWACGAPGLASAEGDRAPGPPRADAPHTVGPLTVGVVAPADADVARELADGATLACEEATRAGRVAPRVVVRAVAAAWGSAGSVTVALAREDRADVVVAPPDAATAHEVVQLASKVGVPVLSTSPARSVAGTGSPWCVTMADEEGRKGSGTTRPAAPPWLVAGFAMRFGRAPGPDAVAAYHAIVCVVAASPTPAGDARARRDALRDGAAVARARAAGSPTWGRGTWRCVSW